MSGFFERALRPASLRGEGFYVEATEDEPSRRIAVHEFPGRDDPWHEDLGRAPQQLRIDGFLIGDDVARQARRFRQAALAPGPARLVHPWLGEVEVVVLGARIGLATNEGRLARLSFACQRTGAAPAPVIGLGAIERVLAAVDSAVEAVLAEVQRVQAAIAQGEAAAATVLGLAQGGERTIRRVLTGGGLAQLLGGSLGAALSDLATMPQAEAAGPAEPAKRGAAVFSTLSGLALDGGAEAPAALDALLTLAATPAFPLPAPDGTTAGAAATEGAAAIDLAWRIAAAAQAAATAEAMPFEVRDDAIRVRDRLSTTLADLADEAGARGWDAAWRQALALRAASIASISGRAAPLPALARLTLPAALPSVALAFRLDGDDLAGLFERAAAIVGRNRVQNPLMVPAGRPIEVLR